MKIDYRTHGPQIDVITVYRDDGQAVDRFHFTQTMRDNNTGYYIDLGQDEFYVVFYVFGTETRRYCLYRAIEVASTDQNNSKIVEQTA